MSTVGLISLGCSKNLVDSEHMLALLRDAGYGVTDDLAQADVGIVNTCGFIEAAKTEAIETILETAQYKAQGSMQGLIMTGCLAQRYREDIRDSLPEVDAICGTGSYENIVDAVRDVLAHKRAEYFADMTSAALDGARYQLTPPYTSYFKIAEGCSNTCAYCIIPKLRGKFRSRPLESLLEEAQRLSDAGVKELIVIAQDITVYGRDLYREKKLPELLRALCKMDFTWIRLHYLYPDQITEDMIDVIASEEKIVKYLDIPLQHVSRRILRSMRRPGDGDEFRALIAHLRARMPELVIRTSLIVGLPGETEAEFTELCEFLHDVKLERVGVFAYSPEEGTIAAELPDQIPDDVKQRRRLIVEELQSGVLDGYNQRRVGTCMQVLTEGFDEELQQYYGRTYADSVEVDGKVFFTSEADIAAGTFVTVYIEDQMGPDLVGLAQEVIA